MSQPLSNAIQKILFNALLREHTLVAMFARGDESYELVSCALGYIDQTEALTSGIRLPVSLLDQIDPSGQGSVLELDRQSPPVEELEQFATRFGVHQFAAFATPSGQDPHVLVLVGCRGPSPFVPEELRTYASAIKLAASRVAVTGIEDERPEPLAAMEALSFLSSEDIISGNLSNIYTALHDQATRLVGDFSFYIGLFDEATNSINIPYLYEEGNRTAIDTFPLGEGLTSILISTGQPLLLNRDAEKQAKELGAKFSGKPAKSWLGIPLSLEGRVIGCLVVQDMEQENSFDEEDVHALSFLAGQFAGVIQIMQALEKSRKHLAEVYTAAEIARDISSALNLDELLLKAVNLIRDRFKYYHAAIFLADNAGANVVIREATGEAGAQMKRMGHKLAIGSKSIIGYVSSQGESLIVNDTNNDAMHLPNPLLPETRAEAAIPMKIGDRILGVLDVQSEAPFSFSPQEIKTLQVLADQLAIAVTNTELFAETQEHLSQHRLLHHITSSAASGTTLDEALNSTVQGLQVTLGGDRVVILLADDERKTLAAKAWVGYSPEIATRTVPIGSGITGWVAAHRRPLRVNDVTQDARYIELSPNTKSELAVPLIFRSDFLGVLNVESEHMAAYSENDEEMLGTLAGSIAAIVANAKLIEQIRRQVERERQLYEISNKIRRSTNVQNILLTTINELNRVTGARHTEVRVGIRPDERGFHTKFLEERNES